jgi:predicted lipoprotein with Yx(FWY)xxD motif
MNQTKEPRVVFGRIPLGRVMVAAAVLGGFAAPMLAVNAAGAAVGGHASKSVVVSIAKSTKFGSILVSGKTLYSLQPSKTACTAACLKVWPELVLPKGITKATAGTGVSASKLGTVAGANGVRQVTYNGKALYWFSGDNSGGKVNGNLTDTWGKWSDVVLVKPTGPGSGGTTGGTTAGTGGTAF